MKFKRTLAILLSAFLLMCGLSLTALADNAKANITLKADKTHAITGDVVTYTVYLSNSNKLENGVYNFTFDLVIGAGLEYVTGSYKLDATDFAAKTGINGVAFNESALHAYALGRMGDTGYTGEDVAIMTFQCKVTADADGNATVSTGDVRLTNKSSATVKPAASSVSVHANTLVAQPGKAATCTVDGVKAHDKCSICNKLFINHVEVDDVTIKAAGHGEHEVKDPKDATCTENGYTGDTYCKDCGEKIKSGEVITATGHGETEVKDAVLATCTKDGYTGDTYCKDCGEKIKSGEAIKAKGHTNTEVKGAVFATCTKDGYTGDTYCKDCGEKIKSGEVIKADGHPNTEVKDAVSATCTKDGYTGDTYCKDCGEKIKSGEVIKAKGHTSEVVGKADASCEADGYTGDEKCTVCGETLKKGEKIPATGHDYDKDGNCKNCGHLDPETGDVSLVFPWVLVMAVCIGAAYVTLRKRSNT